MLRSVCLSSTAHRRYDLPVLRTLTWFVVILVGALPWAARVASPEPQTPASKPALSALLGAVEYRAAALSPDGRFAAICGPTSVVLWDADRGRELARFGPLERDVTSVAFSADGRTLLVGDRLGGHLYDVATHALLVSYPIESERGEHVVATFAGPDTVLVAGAKYMEVWTVAGTSQRRVALAEGSLRSIATPRDGSWVAAASLDGPVEVFDLTSGELIAELDVPDTGVFAVAASPDGALIATSSTDGRLRLWKPDKQKPIRTFGKNESSLTLAFSPDGRLLSSGTLAVGGDDDEKPMEDPASARLWDTKTGRLLRRLPVGGFNDMEVVDVEVTGTTFSADGKEVLLAALYGSAVRLSLEGDKELARFQPPATQLTSVVMSPDGTHLALGRADGRIRVFDLRSGRPYPPWQLGLGVHRLEFLPDSRRLMASSNDEIVVWRVGQRQAESRLTTALRTPKGKREANWLQITDLLEGGATVVVADRTGGAWLVELATGKVLRGFRAFDAPISALAASPDGTQLATASADGLLCVSEVATARVTLEAELPEPAVAACFVRAGGPLVLGDAAGGVEVLDPKTGKVVRELVEGDETAIVYRIVASVDGSTVFVIGENSQLWRTDTWTIDGLEGEPLTSGSLSPDGRHVVSDAGMDSHGARLVGRKDDTRLFVFEFRDDTWAVVDGAGRYDASGAGLVPALHWAVNNEVVALDQLKSRYYEPGLLPRALGLSDEPLRDVAAFDRLDLFPEATVATSGTVVTVHLRNRGGGIGPVVLRVNGKEWSADVRPAGSNPQAAELDIRVDLAGDPRLATGLANRIEVEAWNAEGYLRSRGVAVDFGAPGQAVAAAEPQLYAVVAGVSDYAGAAIDLQYPSKDAKDFGTALRLAADSLFGADRVHVQVLTDAGRAELVAALGDIAKQAAPTDIVVLYLAGHGISRAGTDGEFYYLTREAASDDLTDPAVRSAVALSSSELVDLVNRVPARKQVLVLDTCASGAFVQALTKARGVPSSQIRALERVKDRTGLHVLAGCAADRVSYEASRFGQGLLTYSLLLGMRGAALREQEYLDVDRLFGFASDTVPELAQDIGGIQRPVVAAPEGGQSFDLGRLPGDVRAKVPLQQVRPVLIRSSFQDEDAFADVLRLGAAADRALRDAAAVRPAARFVFVDADDMPDALRLVGRYRVKNETVQVTARLHGTGAPEGTFEVEGQAADLDALAARVVQLAQERLPAPR